MGTTRGKPRAMKRALTFICLGLALGLAFGAGSAPAKTVYDYTYSGTFIDGSTIGKPFNGSLAGLTFDRHSQRLMVANGGTPATISRWNLNGTPSPFSTLGTPWFQIEPSGESRADIAIDQSGGPTDGNFYVRGAGSTAIVGYKPDGTPLGTDFKGAGGFGFSCGIAVSPDGKEIIHSDRGGLYHYDASTGENTKTDFIGPEGIQPGVKVRGGELLTACHMSFDNNGDLYAVAQGGGGFGGGGTAFKLKPDGLQEYMVNHREDTTGVAVDNSDNDVFVLNEGPCCEPDKGNFELYDEDGRLLGSGWGGPEGSYPGMGAGATASRWTRPPTTSGSPAGTRTRVAGSPTSRNS